VDNSAGDLQNQEGYREARRHVAALRGFYIHLCVFIAVMILLTFIDATTSHVWWVQWPFLGWGIALAIHAFATFSGIGFLGPEWEQRKIAELLRRRSQP